MTQAKKPMGLTGKPFVIWSESDAGHDELLPNWHGIDSASLGDGYYLLEYRSGMGDGPGQIFHIRDMATATPNRTAGGFQFFESEDHLVFWLKHTAKYIWERHHQWQREQQKTA